MTAKKLFNKVNVCLVGSEKPYLAFDSVLNILKEIVGTGHVTELRFKDWIGKSPSILKLFFFLLQDLALCFKILSHCKRNETNVVLVFQRYYPLTCIGLKLLSVRLIIYIGGSGFYWSHLENLSTLGRVFVYANLPIEDVCHRFADMIITLSRSMVKTIRIEKYLNKTRFALPRLSAKFFTDFNINKSYESRKNIIGFVGLLARRKGILNFIEAAKLIGKLKQDYRFLIVGAGPLCETVKNRLRIYGLENKVDMSGFVNYYELVKCFNEMKLYVLPAYAEGIPSTIFEAMSCGTPVLVTPVGGIPDIVKESETGFLLKRNDPQHIAARIIDLLDDPQTLKRVSEKASSFLRDNFGEEKILQSWREIFRDMLQTN